MVDGEIFDQEYITKNVVYNSSIVIETPELIKNKVHGDKVVQVRLMQIRDDGLLAADGNSSSVIL